MSDLQTLLQRMRDDAPRFKMFAGAKDVVSAETVDEWADELEAFAASPSGAAPQPDEQVAVAMLAACEATLRHLWDIAGRFESEQCNKIRDEIHILNKITLPSISDLAAHGPSRSASPTLTEVELRRELAQERRFVMRLGEHLWKKIDALTAEIERLRASHGSSPLPSGEQK